LQLICQTLDELLATAIRLIISVFLASIKDLYRSKKQYISVHFIAKYDNLLPAILDRKIVAIIRGADPKHVLDIAQALYNGGVTIVEVTMNSKDPLQSIAAIKEKMGNKMFVGAGSVLDKQMAKAAIEAGSQFIISPSLDIETIKTTKDLGVISIPALLRLLKL
jgi:2-keto-3-deoxy-6-phosphogluconate aldolase